MWRGSLGRFVRILAPTLCAARSFDFAGYRALAQATYLTIVVDRELASVGLFAGGRLNFRD
jgi:hypothetical protein